MALNNSGPISLGGSTVGQSINLELGVSATALASINSTPFRTLAAVPSGAIALSNFYGKSNIKSWVYYLGQSVELASTGSGSLGTWVRQFWWAAGRNSGTVAVGVTASTGSNAQMGLKWIDSDGNLLGTKNINPGSNPTHVTPCYSVGTDYYQIRGINEYSASNFLGVNGGTYTFGLGNSWRVYGSWQQEYPTGNTACADSSGNIIMSGYVATKINTYLHIGKFTNGGSQVGAVQMAFGDQGQYSASCSVYPRSDGTYVCFGHTGGTASNAGGAYVFPNGITAANCDFAYTLANNNGGAGSQFYTCSAFDNVNNISYLLGYSAYTGSRAIARFDSTYSNTHFVGYYDSTDGWNLLDAASGMSYYNNALYMGGGVKTSGGGDFTYLAKIDPSTLAVVWAYKYRVTGGAVVGLGAKYPYINVQATSKGVYFSYTTNTGDSYLFLIGGQPTTGTYTIPSANGGGTFTLTISALSLTATSIPLWSTGTRSKQTGGVTFGTNNYGTNAISSITPNQPVGFTNL